jgi:hypothetical protein
VGHYFNNTTVSANTMSDYLSAVRDLYIQHERPNPTERTVLLKRTLQAMRNARAKQPRKPHKIRLPVTAAMLRHMHELLDMTDFDDCTFWAACVTGYASMMRCGEFTVTKDTAAKAYLRQENVTYTTRGLLLLLRVSKTDRDAKGQYIPVGYGADVMCPITALRHMQAHPQYKKDPKAPLFQQAGHAFLTRSKFVPQLQHLATRVSDISASVVTHFGGHSLRKGACSDAVAAGVSELQLKTLGRWTSDTFQVYSDLLHVDLYQLTAFMTTPGLTTAPRSFNSIVRWAQHS